MTLVVLAVLAAVVLAVLFRGRPSTFGRPSVQRFGLLGIVVIGLSTSLLAKSTGVHAGWLVAAALAMVWFTAVNRGRPGLGLVIGGLALNAVVIIVNAGMPVSLAAVERAGVPLSRVPLDTDPLREELTTETVLPWLGEAVPLALPIRPAVVSPGDVLVAAGGALFLFTGLTGFGRTVPERELTKEERKEHRAARKARRAAEAETRTAAAPAAAPEPGLVTASSDAEDTRETTAPWGPQAGDAEPGWEQPTGQLVAADQPTTDVATVDDATVEATTSAPANGAQAGVPMPAADPSGLVGTSDNGAGPATEDDPATAAAAAAAAAERSRRRKLKRQQKRERKQQLVAQLATGQPDEPARTEEAGGTTEPGASGPPAVLRSTDQAS